MNPNDKVVIGIIGGSGSGKTTVSNYLMNELDATFIEADQIGHSLLNNPNIKAKIVDLFGIRVLDGNVINRKSLGHLVFEDGDALKSLNLIMHDSMYERIEALITASTSDYVILEAAVMIEAGFYKLVNKMIALDAAYDLRLNRLVSLRGIPEAEAIKIIQSQRTDYHKFADYTIDTTMGMKGIESKLKSIINDIREASHEINS